MDDLDKKVVGEQGVFQIRSFCNFAKKWANNLKHSFVKKWVGFCKQITRLLKSLLTPSRSKIHTHTVALSVGALMFVAGTYYGIAHYLIPAIRASFESTHQMPYDSQLPDGNSTAFNRGTLGELAVTNFGKARFF